MLTFISRISDEVTESTGAAQALICFHNFSPCGYGTGWQFQGSQTSCIKVGLPQECAFQESENRRHNICVIWDHEEKKQKKQEM